MTLSFAILLMSGCAEPIVVTDPINCTTFNQMRFDDVEVVDWLVDNDPQLVRDIVSNNKLSVEC